MIIFVDTTISLTLFVSSLLFSLLLSGNNVALSGLNTESENNLGAHIVVLVEHGLSVGAVCVERGNEVFTENPD